jgi:hypothetical protein
VLPECCSDEGLSKFVDWGVSRGENHDIYLFTQGTRSNIKLRREKNSLKLKVLMDTKDEFELWSTEFEYVLPAPAIAWQRTAEALGLPPLEWLATASVIDETLERISKEGTEIRILETRKERTFYSNGPATLEVSRVELPTSTIFTIQFEAPLLGEALKLRAQVGTTGLEVGQNYVDAGIELVGW